MRILDGYRDTGEGKVMVKARAEIIIDRPADVVWARVRDFVDVSWVPGAERSQMDGDLRTVWMKGRESPVQQRLVHHDDVKREFGYRLATDVVLGPGKSISGLEGTFAVTPQGDSSWVTWDVDTDEFIAGNVSKEYQGALNNLKAMLEG